MLLGSEVPSLGRYGKAWPVDIAEERDWQGNLVKVESVRRSRICLLAVASGAKGFIEADGFYGNSLIVSQHLYIPSRS